MRSTILFAAALLALPAAAQAGEIAGTVYDSRALPVAGAAVQVGEREVLTGADGSYLVADMPAGEHEVAVTLADGAVQRVWARVGEDGTSRRNIFLVSAAAMRGARQFAGEAATAHSPTVELPQVPTGEGVVVAWRWRDSDA